MADEATKKSKLEVVSPATPKDALDIEALWARSWLGRRHHRYALA